MIPISVNSTFEPPVAFPGMLADSGFTDKVVVPCGATDQPFGTVVASVTATGVSVLPIGTNNLEGIAIHDHMVGGRYSPDTGGGYSQYDAMSVIRRGRVWALASGTCTKDAVAKYDPATGIFADAGSATYPHAKFLTANISVPGILAGEAAAAMVLVELGTPVIA